jgi:hypothetical protein
LHRRERTKREKAYTGFLSLSCTLDPILSALNYTENYEAKREPCYFQLEARSMRAGNSKLGNLGLSHTTWAKTKRKPQLKSTNIEMMIATPSHPPPIISHTQ